MLNLSLDDLLGYTDWERQKWREFIENRGEQLLAMKAGKHGDGRFQTIGDLIRHIFSAEKRYVERLLGRTLTDTASVPNNKTEAQFEFGRQSRAELRHLIASFPHDQWDVLQELKFGNSSVTATPRKMSRTSCCMKYGTGRRLPRSSASTVSRPTSMISFSVLYWAGKSGVSRTDHRNMDFNSQLNRLASYPALFLGD